MTSNAPPSRKIMVAGAQLGPIHLSSTRSEVIFRMVNLMAEAQKHKVKLIVFPEIAFTTFFPRHLIKNPQELEGFFERAVDGDDAKAPGMKPIFDKAREYKIDVSVGYAECDTSQTTHEHVHYNTAVYFSAAADKIISKYRKIHLPGTVEPYERAGATNQLEKRYFTPGDLGFEAFRAPGLILGAARISNGARTNTEESLGRGDPVIGTMICNDRRWPEAWRCLGLQGVEIVLCGYNTTAWAPELVGSNMKVSTPEKAKEAALFHNKLTLQHGSYVNACWSINVAKCGMEDGIYPLIGGSCIIDPDGEIAVEARTEDDELIFAEIDLEECRRGKNKVFAFERHRRTEHYGRIVSQTGVIEPTLL